jgi:hypothetical protein
VISLGRLSDLTGWIKDRTYGDKGIPPFLNAEKAYKRKKYKKKLAQERKGLENLIKGQIEKEKNMGRYARQIEKEKNIERHNPPQKKEKKSNIENFFGSLKRNKKTQQRDLNIKYEKTNKSIGKSNVNKTSGKSKNQTKQEMIYKEPEKPSKLKKFYNNSSKTIKKTPSNTKKTFKSGKRKISNFFNRLKKTEYIEPVKVTKRTLTKTGKTGERVIKHGTKHFPGTKSFFEDYDRKRKSLSEGAGKQALKPVRWLGKNVAKPVASGTGRAADKIAPNKKKRIAGWLNRNGEKIRHPVKTFQNSMNNPQEKLAVSGRDAKLNNLNRGVRSIYRSKVGSFFRKQSTRGAKEVKTFTEKPARYVFGKQTKYSKKALGFAKTQAISNLNQASEIQVNEHGPFAVFKPLFWSCKVAALAMQNWYPLAIVSIIFGVLFMSWLYGMISAYYYLFFIKSLPAVAANVILTIGNAFWFAIHGIYQLILLGMVTLMNAVFNYFLEPIFDIINWLTYRLTLADTLGKSTDYTFADFAFSHDYDLRPTHGFCYLRPEPIKTTGTAAEVAGSLFWYSWSRPGEHMYATDDYGQLIMDTCYTQNWAKLEYPVANPDAKADFIWDTIKRHPPPKTYYEFSNVREDVPSSLFGATWTSGVVEPFPHSHYAKMAFDKPLEKTDTPVIDAVGNHFEQEGEYILDTGGSALDKFGKGDVGGGLIDTGKTGLAIITFGTVKL